MGSIAGHMVKHWNCEIHNKCKAASPKEYAAKDWFKYFRIKYLKPKSDDLKWSNSELQSFVWKGMQ